MAKTDYGFVGSGTGHISIKDTLGRWRGFTKIGNMEMFELTPESEELTRISNQVGSEGQALDTLFTAKPTKVKYKFNTVTAANMAIALSAALSPDDNVASGTVTAEAHTAWQGENLHLAHRHVSSLVLSTPTAGTGALYTTDNVGYAIGAKEITLITGTGTVLAGDTVTFAGDTTLYAVATGISAPGKIVLMTGLKQAIPAAATAMTIRAAITALSATTDYKQDTLNNHYVEILKTGVIADGGKVLAAYSYQSATRDAILGGVTSFEARIEINGVNRSNENKQFTLYAGKLTLVSQGGFSWLGKEFAAPEVEGVANIDDDTTSPSYGLPWKAWVNEVATA